MRSLLSDLLNAHTIQVEDGSAYTWEDAIRKAAQPLIDLKFVETAYVDSMIDVVKEEGPYINIGPQVALAHARPNDSVHKIGLSLLKTNSSVDLVSEDHPVKLWFVLAATDSNSHLSVIQQLMTVLTNNDILNKLLEAPTVDAVMDALDEADEAEQ
ncbi:phosphoenolpyruvate-dependent sugar phosphotransferase system, EIIA 2 [Lentilactobacillus rapi DSM 19907 = JCM 15042]|uniref:Ascorbate-specific PTS system EIIA component n=1 Tax=Lentilactobacillus rapi DSM 19907 = JCM 15042 TaxID=1423795 RepID=A0ABR5PEN6_9LACO|nr:PTS sugar transporter subunit IIA [Lentilactobacillus rapi]KRL17541.1 phosphoenolpyruvate-dependent sugar phosphotransferase system, EIIA 2 [Lentilactobacillus rapi DSM 19907 = JCM 15042]